jgi:hypothetical protein
LWEIEAFPQGMDPKLRTKEGVVKQETLSPIGERV